MAKKALHHQHRQLHLPSSKAPPVLSPSSVRESDDYQSDFDLYSENDYVNSDNENEGDDDYLRGEAIDDQLRLSTAFESEVEGEGEGDTEGEIEEERDVRVSPPSRRAVKGSAMDNDDNDDNNDEEDYGEEVYEEEFTNSPYSSRERDRERERERERQENGEESAGYDSDTFVLSPVHTARERVRDKERAPHRVPQRERESERERDELQGESEILTAVLPHSALSSLTLHAESSIVTEEDAQLLLLPGAKKKAEKDKEKRNAGKKSSAGEKSVSLPSNNNNKSKQTSSSSSSRITTARSAPTRERAKEKDKEKVTLPTPRGVTQGAHPAVCAVHLVHQQAPATSSVATRNSLSVGDLQRQLHVTLRRLRESEQEKQALRRELESSAVHAMIEQLRQDMGDKDRKIAALSDELHSMQSIARFQEKQLIQTAREKAQKEENNEDISVLQEKYLAVLQEQLKNLRNKYLAVRESEKRLTKQNEKKEKENEQLRKKVAKWRTQAKENERRCREWEERAEREGTSERPDEQPQEIEKQRNEQREREEDRANNAKRNEIIERSLSVQLKNAQRDLLQAKLSLQESERQREIVETELQKRELFARHQTTVLRSLRQDFEELRDTNKQLLHAAALFNRDLQPPKEKKQTPEKPLSDPPKMPFFSFSFDDEENDVPKAKQAMLVSERDDQCQPPAVKEEIPESDHEGDTNVSDTTTFLTRIEEHHDTDEED